VKRTLLLATLVIALARCATIDHGPMQRIRVDSDPMGATVRTKSCGPGSTKVTETAGVVWVNRRATRCTLTFSAPGFQPQSVPLHRVISDKTFQNAKAIDGFCDAVNCTNGSDFTAALFLGGFFAGTGFAVDAVTGAMFTQDPNEVYVELEPDP